MYFVGGSWRRNLRYTLWTGPSTYQRTLWCWRTWHMWHQLWGDTHWWPKEGANKHLPHVWMLDAVRANWADGRNLSVQIGLMETLWTLWIFREYVHAYKWWPTALSTFVQIKEICLWSNTRLSFKYHRRSFHFRFRFIKSNRVWGLWMYNLVQLKSYLNSENLKMSSAKWRSFCLGLSVLIKKRCVKYVYGKHSMKYKAS